MAYRTWGRVLLAALLVGIVSGAGQLGIAYGLGLVRFNRNFEGATVNHWPAQLGWVGWFAMVAAVAGALAADRLSRRYALPSTLGNRAAVSALAALGALVVAPLSMQPARAAQVASADPVSLTGVAAVIGAGVGFVAALAALSQRPVVWNIGALTGAVWFLAVLSVLPSLGPSDPLPAVRLGGVDPSWLGAGTSQRLAVVTMPALALIAGALTGALARRRELPTPVVASCGVAGPAMLALAYVVAGRGDSADAYQAAPYWGALAAVGAGALGSALAAWARWPLTTPASTPATDVPTQATGDPAQATGVAAQATGAAAQAGAGDSVGAAGLGGSAGTTAPEGGTAGTATAGIGTAGTAATGSSGTATVGGDGGGTATAGSGGGGTAGANGDDDAPTDSIPTVNTPSGTAGSTPSWRLDIPHPEHPTADTGTGTGTTPTGTWTPGPAAAGGRTYGEPTEPYREQPPSTGNWSFDIGRGIPSPRASTEDSAPTERYGSPAPAVSEGGQWSNTEPAGRAGAGPSAASADAEPSAGWSGARRLRTEDFWPTTTPPSTPTPTPTPPAPATTPPVPAAPPSAAAAPPGPPATTAPPIPPSPRAATSASAPASPARTDDVWDAFAPVIRPRADRLPPIPVVSGNTPVQTTPVPGTPLPVTPAPETAAKPQSDPQPQPQPESESGTEDAERPTGRIRRGLFRRNRGSADSEQTGTGETGKGDPKQNSGESKPGRGESKQREAKGRNRTEEPVPARDEEYVDWVSGLSEPDPNGDDLGLDRSVRRSLRSTGRHHAD